MKKRSVCIYVIFLLFPCFSYSQQPIDIQALSIDQLNKLSSDKIESLPYIDVAEKQFSEMLKEKKEYQNKFHPRKIAIAIIEIALNDFKFYNKLPQGTLDSDLVNAIKLFQQSINHEATGVLSLKEFKILMERQDETQYKNIIPIGVGDSPIIFRYANSVTASGTWTMTNDKLAYPINTSKISCEKEIMGCRDINAYVAEFQEGGNPMLNIEITYYSIIKWDENEIIAEDSSKCRISSLIINTTSKQATVITRDKTSDQCDIFENNKLPKISTPRITQLKGGLSIESYYAERSKKTSTYYNQEYVNAIKSLIPDFTPIVKRFSK